MNIDSNSVFLLIQVISTLASLIGIFLAWRIMRREARCSAQDILMLSQHFLHRDIAAQNYVGRDEFAKLCAHVFTVAQAARSINIAELWDLYCDAEIAKAVANGEMPREENLED